MSPRIVPKNQLPPDVEAAERHASRVRARLGTDGVTSDPTQPSTTALCTPSMR